MKAATSVPNDRNARRGKGATTTVERRGWITAARTAARWSPALAITILLGIKLGDVLIEREATEIRTAASPQKTLAPDPTPALAAAAPPTTPTPAIPTAAPMRDAHPTTSGEAQQQPIAASLPRPDELLPNPIQLPDCPGVTIVEWRADAHVPWTGPSTERIDAIDRACGLALRRYPEFLASKGLTFTATPLHIPVSLIPANTILDGKRPRNMNDANGRFAAVTPRNPDGTPYVLWGVYDLDTGSLFVRNDPMTKGGRENRFFTRIFLHEFGHALADAWGVHHREFHDDKDADEKLQSEWTRFAGYGFEDDSSFDDCYRKGLGDATCIH